MKTPMLYQRCMAKVSYFWLIRFFFHTIVVSKNHSKDLKFLHMQAFDKVLNMPENG